MPTKRERKEALKKKYYERKEKLWVLFGILVVYIILFGLLAHSILWVNINLIILLTILIVIFIPVSVFLIDSMMFEAQ